MLESWMKSEKIILDWEAESCLSGWESVEPKWKPVDQIWKRKKAKTIKTPAEEATESAKKKANEIMKSKKE